MFSALVEPPTAESIRASVCRLEQLGALDPEQQLTPLGYHLAQLPVDVRWVVKNMVVTSTVRCRYNVVNFLTNIHKRHPISRPLGRDMGCLLWIQYLIDILPQFLQSFLQYLTILDRIITALECMLLEHISSLILSVAVSCCKIYSDLRQEGHKSSWLWMKNNEAKWAPDELYIEIDL